MTFQKIDQNAIAQAKKNYLATLTAPQDAYWQEGLIGASDHYLIRVEDAEAGYFALDADNQLMQFHLERPFHRQAPQLFQQVLQAHQIKTAFAATIEPFYFSLCLDVQTKVEVHTYLFAHNSFKDLQPAPVEGCTFRKAGPDDLNRVLPLFGGGDEFVDTETVDANFGSMLGYAKMVIQAGILHVLEKDREVLGIGEFRIREGWAPHVDVGVIVSSKHRRKGLASHILKLLAQKAVQAEMKPICSCEEGNSASRKAVENAGFIPRHRVVRFSF